MKTYFLVFAFLPVFLAYVPAGDIRSAPVFWTLIILAFAIEELSRLAAKADKASNDAIINAYAADGAASSVNGWQLLKSISLFVNRGAA